MVNTQNSIIKLIPPPSDVDKLFVRIEGRLFVQEILKKVKRQSTFLNLQGIFYAPIIINEQSEISLSLSNVSIKSIIYRFMSRVYLLFGDDKLFSRVDKPINGAICDEKIHKATFAGLYVYVFALLVNWELYKVFKFTDNMFSNSFLLIFVFYIFLILYKKLFAYTLFRSLWKYSSKKTSYYLLASKSSPSYGGGFN